MLPADWSRWNKFSYEDYHAAVVWLAFLTLLRAKGCGTVVGEDFTSIQ